MVDVSAGDGHTLAVRSDGSVLAWGLDSDGQLGDGGVSADQSTPVPVFGFGAGSGVVAVSAGSDHSLALRSDGSVWAWGDNDFGQLGDRGATIDQQTPVPVSGLGSGVVAVSAGGDHSVALRSDGSVMAWGQDYSGQLGDDHYLLNYAYPRSVFGLGAGSGVVAVSAGRIHSLALRSDGSVVAWGGDDNGQLGDGGANTNRPWPVPVVGLGVGSGAVAVSAGYSHSLAVRSNGSVWAWGDDDFGQLGDEATTYDWRNDVTNDQSIPVPVFGLGPGSGMVGVSGGLEHSLGVRSDGSVMAWGKDFYHQLGHLDDGATYHAPVPVYGLGAGSGVVAVEAGEYHSLARKSPGPTFASVSPARVWDTRVGPGPTGRIGAGHTRDVTVTGLGGVPVAGVTAVVLNVTAVNPSAGTYVTVWPTGQPRPLASNLNIPPGDTRPNLVTVKVGAGGRVSFYNGGGTNDLLADVAGWYGPTGGQRYTPVSPARMWDARVGPGPTGRVGARQSRDVAVTGLGGVPASGVSAVVLNVTAVNPSAGTYVTVWPTGQPRPVASNLNIPPGDTRPNLVTVKVGASGQVSFYNDAGTIDLLADVAGYYGNAGASFNSVSPARVKDTRVGPGPIGRIGAGQTVNFFATGVGGVPGNGVTALVLNVTAVNPTAGTYLTVWPTGEPRPLASNLNIPPGDTRANLVIVKASGQVNVYNHTGTTELIVDVAGWFGTPGT